MQLKMIYGEPAAIWGKMVLISDPHIGARGLPPWDRVAGVVRGILHAQKKKKLMILGDVKSGVSSQDAKAGNFIRELGQEFELHIVKGNHDGNIEKYGAYCTVHGPEGAVIEGLGCVHGHAWPSLDVLSAGMVAMGHAHPRFVHGREFRRAEMAWVFGKLSADGLAKRHIGIGRNWAPQSGKKIMRTAKEMPGERTAKEQMAGTGMMTQGMPTQDVPRTAKGTVGIREIAKRMPKRDVPICIFPPFGAHLGASHTREGIGPLMREDIFIKASTQIYLLNGIQVR